MPAHRNGGDAPACAGDLRAPIQDGTPEGRYQTEQLFQIPVVDDNIRASRFVLIWQRRDLQTSGTTGRSPYQMAVSIIPGMA